MDLSRGGRAALTFPFLASVCLALCAFGAPAEGSYGVLTRGRGSFLVTLDPEGHRTSIQTPKGQQTTTTFDELGKPLDITQPKPSADAPANPVTHFRYDENRNLVRMEDADGRVTKLEYDALNRLFKTTRDPDGLNLVSETTDFDEDGHPLRIAEANGEVTRQTWDEVGRLSTRTHEPLVSGWTAPWAYTTDERYHYDPNSNLERVEETDVRKDGSTPPERVTRRGYDRLDRQTSEEVTLQNETTSSVATEYFKDGRVKSVTDPRGVTSYTYDGQGREGTATTSGGVTRKTYYPDGLVKDVTFPNGTKRAHGYDKADRLLTIVTTKDEAAVASTAYTYDSNGNRLTQVQTNGGSEETTAYTYDDLDRLATVTYAPDPGHPNGRKVTYGHDGAGNRETEVVTDPQTEAVLESKTGHFDNANRLTELTDNLDAAQTTTLLWDKNGSLLSETKAGVTTTYRYDLRDTLAEMERGDQPLARFLGDFDERRVLKIGDPTRPGGSGVQEYLYNGSRLVVEVEGGQSTARYEWTNEELVSLLQSGGARRYFAVDGLETVLALTDEVGQATDRLNFDAWGVPKVGTDFGTSGNRFAFTSHRFDTELNLYYAGGRMYSPTIGRFISQDTLSLDPNNPDTWNLFSYARANPTRYVDPTGHQSETANPAVSQEALRQWEEYGKQHPVEASAAAATQPNTEVPEGTVHEEGLLTSAWRWYSTKREAAKRWVRDQTGALGRKLFSPSSNTAREEQIQLAFQGRPEAGAGTDYNERRKIGEGVQQVSGDVTAAGGELAAEGAIQYVEAQGAGTVIGSVVQGAGRARQAVRNAAKGAEEAVELEVQTGRRAVAAEAGVAKRADDAVTVGGGARDTSYVVDDAGLTVRAEGRVTGPHRGRGKGYRPEPAGGRAPGEHRGHLIPEGGVDQPGLVNVRENIISETAASNLGPKKALDNLVSRMAAESPNSVVRVIAEPLRRPNETRPFAVTYWIEKDGVRITGQTILNK